MDSVTKLINNSSKLIGTRQVLKAIIHGDITQVIIAANTDEGLREQITAECKIGNIPFQIALTKSELGKLCKLDVPCAVVGLLKT